MAADKTVRNSVAVADPDIPANVIKPNADGSVNVSAGTGASASQVQGVAASGATALGNPVQGGNVALSSPSTFTTGQVAADTADLNGLKRVRVAGHSATLTNGVALSSSVSFDLPSEASSTTVIRPLAAAAYLNNGSSLDMAKSIQGSAVTGLGTGSVAFGELDGTRLSKAQINISTATTTAVVAGTASQSVRVYKMLLNFSAVQTLDIITSSGASLCGGAMTFGVAQEFMLTFDGEPWYVTTAADGLSFITTTIGVVRGTVYYRKEA